MPLRGFEVAFWRLAVRCETKSMVAFVGLAYEGKDIIVFRFIIEYRSLTDFGPY